ncbi:MAG: orotate phosphoribosyltransferase [Methanospirillum sp.]|uniref:orotate phosphoribosyltransferase n=1 Tax=Methanospirillum sp. TaxID=45200 RepID=UPI002374D29C|nr:orotate phosphoribosyltransferase [Methanospirillum sp.]MDD1730476.1 orotate phosphoribosyltransferase [Methanospirillum sp.]
MVEKNLKDLLIDVQAIRFGDFTLASGKKSGIYIDIKMAMTNPDILKVVARSVTSLNIFWDVAAGVAVGGIPLAVASSLESGKPYVIIRKEQKGHGLSSLIIGDVHERRVLMIEDVTTSGGSALFGVEQIRKAGGIITDIISVVDRNEGATKTLKEAGITLTPLISITDLLQN